MRDLGDKKYTCSSIFLASLVCVLPPEAAYARGTSVELTPTDSFVVGGEPVSTCQWPTAVYLDSAGCTGTLVAPNVITYAAHCGKNVATSVQFGEGGSNGFSRKVAIESCAVNPSFNQNFGEGVDFAYCILAEKITDIPITPIMHGCEREAVRAGEKVWIVGFGNTQGKPQGGGGGTKREVQVSINSVKDNGEVVVGGSGARADGVERSRGQDRPVLVRRPLCDASWWWATGRCTAAIR